MVSCGFFALPSLIDEANSYSAVILTPVIGLPFRPGEKSMKHSCFLAFSVALMWGATALADLENHYNFDTEATLTDDSSGNGRSGFLDDLEVGWVDDEVRGGVRAGRTTVRTAAARRSC